MNVGWDGESDTESDDEGRADRSGNVVITTVGTTTLRAVAVKPGQTASRHSTMSYLVYGTCHVVHRACSGSILVLTACWGRSCRENSGASDHTAVVRPSPRQRPCYHVGARASIMGHWVHDHLHPGWLNAQPPRVRAPLLACVVCCVWCVVCVVMSYRTLRVRHLAAKRREEAERMEEAANWKKAIGYESAQLKREKRLAMRLNDPGD